MANKRVARKAFRQMAVDRLKQCENIVALSKELGVHQRLLYRLREQLQPAESADRLPRVRIPLGPTPFFKQLDQTSEAHSLGLC
jgi:hypothetical protein